MLDLSLCVAQSALTKVERIEFEAYQGIRFQR